jgi:very-short-patch-repair endonuclease
MDEILRALAERAETQYGAFSLDQATDAGLASPRISRLTDSGALVRLGPRSFTFPGQAPCWRRSLQAGLFDLGDGALIADLASAALLGLDGFREGPVEFRVERSQRNRSAPGLVRSGPPLAPIDRVEVDGLATMSAAACIVSMAGRVPLAQLQDAIDSAARLGWSSAAFLRRRLAAVRGRGVPGVRALDVALGDAGGHTRLERQFLSLVRRAGLPRPRTQVSFRAGSRVIARVDALFGSALVVEVAGHGTHATRRQRQRDAQRQAELAVMGYVVLTFTYEDVIQRPEYVIGTLRRALLGAAA